MMLGDKQDTDSAMAEAGDGSASSTAGVKQAASRGEVSEATKFVEAVPVELDPQTMQHDQQAGDPMEAVTVDAESVALQSDTLQQAQPKLVLQQLASDAAAHTTTQEPTLGGAALDVSAKTDAKNGDTVAETEDQTLAPQPNALREVSQSQALLSEAANGAAAGNGEVSAVDPHSVDIGHVNEAMSSKIGDVMPMEEDKA